MNSALYHAKAGGGTSYSYQRRKEDAGLILCPPRSPRGGQRRADDRQRLIDFIGEESL